MQDHPKLSYGNHIDNDQIVVFRVDEGDFTGTVFCFANVVPGDDNLEYECDFMNFIHKSVELDKPDSVVMQKFYTLVASPLLTNTITSAAQTVE